MAKYSKKAGEKVGEVMDEMKKGKLKSGSGKKVTSRRQAIAIGLSEARDAGAKVPKKAAVKRAASEKAAKKAAPKKALAKKASPEKTAPKKAAPKKAAGGKSAPAKSSSKKPAPGKAGKKSR